MPAPAPAGRAKPRPRRRIRPAGRPGAGRPRLRPGRASISAAFGDEGHRVVGLIAETHLKGARALTEARRSCGRRRRWRTRRSGPTRSRPRPTRTATRRSSGWPIPRRTRITTPTRRSKPIATTSTLTGARPTDIVQMMRECVRVLRGKSSVFTPREALRMLAHLVGDLHQPLHVGNAFVTAATPLRFVPPERTDRMADDVGRQRARLRAAGSVQPPLLLGHPHRQPGDAQR